MDERIGDQFTNEAQLQQLLINAINSDTLSDIIEDTAGLEEFNFDSDENQFPNFSIDYISRMAAMQAGKNCLRSLSILVRLTEDQNVSLERHESLRPDIICINPEEHSIVLFELKKSSHTGRQSLTELLAYEHEVRNYLPLLSDYDFNFILISSEWTTLMEHAASSAISWSGKKLLCLKAGLDNGVLKLKTHVPKAWHITGSVYLPETALPCVTVCLYRKDAYAQNENIENQSEEPDKKLSKIFTAIDVMAREGDRIGSHGFVLLWKDCWHESMADYNITVCNVDPFALYQSSRQNSIVNRYVGKLTKALDQYIVENDPSGHPESLSAVAKSAYPILKEISDPMIEGFHTWQSDRLKLMTRGDPIRCEFWGALGHFARAYVTDPAIRRYRRNMLCGGSADWRHPSVGLPLIGSFFKPTIFSEGEVRCGDAFRLGVLLGLDRLLRNYLRKSDQRLSSLQCRYEWNRIELITALDEMRLLANAASNVNSPESPFRFDDDWEDDDEEEFKRFSEWLNKEFFQGSKLHIECFYIGFNGALTFDEALRDIVHQSDRTRAAEAAVDSMRNVISVTIKQGISASKEKALGQNQSNLLKFLSKMVGLRSRKVVDLTSASMSSIFEAWPLCLKLTDGMFSSVLHIHFDITFSQIDWAWLKHGVDQMRSAGVSDAGVILLANGQIVTGRVSPLEIFLPIHVSDADDQVLLLDRSNGIGVLRLEKWERLRSGAAFGKVLSEAPSSI